MAEGARLESVYTATYRGFESPPHRHILRRARTQVRAFFFAYSTPSGSPDRCAASPPGNSATPCSSPRGGAMRVPGLQYRRLPIARSPGKAFTPQPGEYAVTRYCCGFFPACAALSRATGPQIAGNPSPDRRIAPPPGLWQMLILFHPLILFAEKIHQRPDRGE